MLNQTVLVGRVRNITTTENGTKLSIIVPRSYKNEKGEYDNDIISVKLFDSISKNATEYLKTGDVVGIKGRLADKDGLDGLTLVAEKLTFLSSNKNNEEEK